MSLQQRMNPLKSTECKKDNIMALFGKKNNDKNEKENENLSGADPVPAAEQIKPEFTAANTVANTERPKFETPAGFDFNRYFLAERRIVLENVSYEARQSSSKTPFRNCIFNITINIMFCYFARNENKKKIIKKIKPRKFS